MGEIAPNRHSCGSAVQEQFDRAAVHERFQLQFVVLDPSRDRDLSAGECRLLDIDL